MRKALLAAALIPTSRLRRKVKPRLDAIETRDRKLIALDEQPKVGDSLALDAAAVDECQNDNRWDYLVSVPAAARIIGIEPHSAKDSEIGVVIKKKKWAVDFLRPHLVPGTSVACWVWVTQGKVGFSSTERARRRPDQAGIAFAGRILRSFTA